jgi:hypothetical protein
MLVLVILTQLGDNCVNKGEGLGEANCSLFRNRF